MQCVKRDSQIPQPKPNTFAGLMEMYENNYIKIKKLCGNIHNLHEYNCSQIDDGVDLYLQVIERTKYTITLNLTYKFTNECTSPPKVLPNLFIRIYFDAMQAEVLRREMTGTKQNRYSHKRLGNKWRDNRFLYKWLSYCLAQGHSFISEECSINSF